MGRSLNLNKISRALSSRAQLFDGAVAKVGIPAGKTYPDGTSIAYIAAIQEFGANVPAHTVTAKGKALAIPTKNGGTVFRKSAHIPAMKIPPRPAFRNTRTAKAAQWAKSLAAGAAAVIERRIGLEEMLEAVGHVAAMDVVETIASRVAPPLKPSTVDNRIRRATRANSMFGAKSMPLTISTPLNDSGTLVAHVSYGTGPAGETFTGGKSV